MNAFALWTTGAVLAFAMPAGAATMFQDTFVADAQPGSGFDTVTSLTNWTVTAGNIDIFRASSAPGGVIDLDGSSSQAPAVMTTTQSFAFLMNATYTLSLEFVVGTQQDAMTASIGAFVLSLPGGFSPLGNYELTFTALSDFSAPITLAMGPQPNNFGPYLDTVTLTSDGLPTTAPVPLPAAAPMLLAALGGLGVMSRRHKRA